MILTIQRFWILLSCVAVAVSGAPSVENDVDDKIIGGSDVGIPGRFPYQVSLQSYEELMSPTGIIARMVKFCGGTIISRNLILTAAHCMNLTDPNFIKTLYINAGVTDAYCYEGSSQLIRAKKAFVHEKYDPNLITNDVAVVELSRPLEYSDRVNYAKLPLVTYKPSGEGVITGWGQTGPLEENQCHKLKYAKIPIVSYEECKKEYWRELNKDNICVGEPQATASSCPGDSGGPLAINNRDRNPTVVGICSFGGEKCDRYPSAYVNVAKHLDWIQDKLNKHAIY